MHIFINRYREVRSGWALVLGVFLTNLLALPATMLFNLLVIPHYENITPKPLSYAVLETSSFLLQQGSYVAGSILVFYICTKRPARQMGYNLLHLGNKLLLGTVVGSGTIFLSFFLLWLTGQIEVVAVNISVFTSSRFWMYMVVFIAVGLGEETLTRGFMTTILKITRQPIMVLLLPSLIFSIMHLLNPDFGWISFINIFLLGVLFFILFLRSGSLWTPIMAHFVWNWLQGGIFGLNVSGLQMESLLDLSVTGTQSFLTGGAFGIEGSLLLTAVLLGAVALCFLFLKHPDDIVWTLDSDLPFELKKNYYLPES